MEQQNKNAHVMNRQSGNTVPTTVLIIDDLLSSRLTLANIVRQIASELEVLLYDDPHKALSYAETVPVDLVLTEHRLPKLDGIEIIRRIRAMSKGIDVPIVCITMVDDQQLRYQAFAAGVTDFLVKPLDEHETRARCANLLELRRHKLMVSAHAQVLEQRVEEVVKEIRDRELETLAKLARVGEYRDHVSTNHIARMTKYAGLMGHQLGLGDHVHLLEVAAPMHDIGKIAIPDAILTKQGPLTEDEAKLMKTHPQVGYEILRDSPSQYLQTAALIALRHHERWDGTGYPGGLKGEEIPLVARIVSVADVFDALLNNRPYKRAWPLSDGLAYLESVKGTQFDPQCVDAFLKEIDEIKLVLAQFADP